MKKLVAMINDCCGVGANLLREFPTSMVLSHVLRGRGWYDKTLGILLKVWKQHALIYHVHYALQDAWIAERLGKHPLVVHAHGSDVREGLKSRMWSRMVRHNLRHADYVLVSTPDLLESARSVCEDAEWLPNLIDRRYFFPMPKKRRAFSDLVRVLICDCNYKVKGTDIALKALAHIRDRVLLTVIKSGPDVKQVARDCAHYGLNHRFSIRVPQSLLNLFYWGHDVVLDRFKIGSMGMVSLEAISSGTPALCYVSSDIPENKGFPILNLQDPEEIAYFIMEADRELWERQYAWVTKHHDPLNVVTRLNQIYQYLLDHRTPKISFPKRVLKTLHVKAFKFKPVRNF